MITRSRQVALLLFDEVEVLDFAGAIQVLTLAGRHWNWRPFKIHTVAVTPGLINTCNQLRVEASVGFDQCPPPEILILPGGYGAVKAAKDPQTVAWLTSVVQQAELCCCIGNGALLLEATGKFAGELVSVSQSTASQLKPSDTLIPSTVERLIAGPKVLSARSCEGSLDLGFQIIERLLGASIRKRVQTELMLAGDPSPIDLAGLPDDVNDTEQR